MKHQLLQIRIDDQTLANLKEAIKDNPETTASQFVREAIREKLARDIYDIESVPTLRSIRQGIAPIAAVSAPPTSPDQSATGRRTVAELFALHNEQKKEREKAA